MMGFTKYTGATNNITGLNDRPSQQGITPSQLKTKFDKSDVDIKAYINGTLTTELDSFKTTTNEEIQALQDDVTVIESGNAAAHVANQKQAVIKCTPSFQGGYLTTADGEIEIVTPGFGYPADAGPNKLQLTIIGTHTVAASAHGLLSDKGALIGIVVDIPGEGYDENTKIVPTADINILSGQYLTSIKDIGQFTLRVDAQGGYIWDVFHVDAFTGLIPNKRYRIKTYAPCTSEAEIYLIADANGVSTTHEIVDGGTGYDIENDVHLTPEFFYNYYAEPRSWYLEGTYGAIFRADANRAGIIDCDWYYQMSTLYNMMSGVNTDLNLGNVINNTYNSFVSKWRQKTPMHF